MTLIIKEIIIKGIVTNSTSDYNTENINKDEVMAYIKDMKKSIKKDCIESIMSKLETKNIR